MLKKTKIIVVGGGFGGIQLIKRLDENLFDVLLIDKLNHHQFQPLFYQVATSQIEPANISFPLRNIFSGKKNVQIRLAEVIRIEDSQLKIITTIGEFEYDYLIIATGCKTNYYGNNNIRINSFSLKTTWEAIAIRNHILQTFETIISANEEDRESLLNLIIVGAGPTGVELAGAFAEIKKDVLPKDYNGIDFSKFNIILIEGSKDTLNNMSNTAKAASKKYLLQMGITIYTEIFVKDYDGKILTLSNSERIKTKTVIWAAGVTGNIIEGFEKPQLAPGNRLRVNRFNQVLESENIFAIGDIACMDTPKYPSGHPQIANVAITQAKLLSKNLKRIIDGKHTVDYEYRDLGTMATIGTHKAVVDLPFIQFKGYFAWFIWMFLHLMLILRVKNKLLIFINWAWEYFSRDTSLRLILTRTNENSTS